MEHPKTVVDPELERQIENADGELVEAVVRLKPTSAGEIVPSPEETERLVHRLLGRAEAAVQVEANDFNVFENLGYFVVSAPAEYVRALVQEPEVASAIPNRRGSKSD